MKMRSLELCPVHKCEPWTVCPKLCNGTTHELVEMLEESCNICIPPFGINDFHSDFHKAECMLDRMFPDAFFFFNIDFVVFCPECAKKNPFPGKHNKFGCGFMSQFSLASAKSNWNRACARFAKRSIIGLLKGKEQ